MSFAIPSDLLDRLDLAIAVPAEVRYQPPYLPASSVTPAVAANEEEMIALLRGLYRRGFEVPPGEVLQVPKRRGGVRPVTVIDFPSRVLYRALTALLEPDLLSVDRSFEQKEEVERAPAQHPGVTHVVLSDAAAFYDFVDHGLLEEELVAQTGEAVVAETLSRFLEAVMGRDFGLPQVLHPSDVLSETFIDIVERRLLRLQYPVWRFNDDFYLAGSGWPAANMALEALDREIRRLGLTLNENKTLLLRVDHYVEWLDRPEQLWNQTNENVQVDLRAVGPYSDEEGAAEVPDEAVLEAAATVALSGAVPGLELEDRLQVEVNRQLALASLGALSIVESTNGLPFVQQLIGLAPQLTHRVSQYLAAITEDHEAQVTFAYEQLFAYPDIYISPWQALWLFEPLRRMEPFTPAMQEWVARYLAPSFPDLVRARAGLTLAEKGVISESDLVELYGSVAPASADVVLALAHAAGEGSTVLRGVRRDSPINAWIIDGAAEGGAAQG
jgi:Reverse transcriptase (RNA-dependent DNA polymerase)